MVQPINYMALLPQPDIAGQAIALGQEIQRIRGERKAAGQMEAYRNDLQKTFEAGTPEAFSALIAKYPQQREAFKTSWDVLSEGQKNNEFRDTARVYQALQTNPEVAKQIADERITAEENAGGDTTELKQIRGLMDQDPAAAANYLAFTLSSVDPDKWSKMSVERRAAEQAPAELSAKQSAAQEAAVKANFAESNAVQDLAKGGWDIAKIQNDIQVSRQNAQIAAMNAAVAKEKNDLQRQELQQKVEAKKAERDATVREKAAEFTNKTAAVDNLLNTVDRVLKFPVDTFESALGPVSSRLPTLTQGTADLEALVETIGSQLTMSKIDEMTGVLSDSDLKVLRTSVQSIDPRQSPSQMIKNLREIQRLGLKARQNAAEKFGVPETIPDRPEVQVTPEQPAGDVPLPETSGFRVLGVEG